MNSVERDAWVHVDTQYKTLIDMMIIVESGRNRTLSEGIGLGRCEKRELDLVATRLAVTRFGRITLRGALWTQEPGVLPLPTT